MLCFMLGELIVCPIYSTLPTDMQVIVNKISFIKISIPFDSSSRAFPKNYNLPIYFRPKSSKRHLPARGR